MKLLFKYSLRNLWRRPFQTIVILSMIIGSFSAMILFKGFANAMLIEMEESITLAHVGHLQIATQDRWNEEFLGSQEDWFVKDPSKLLHSLKQNQMIKSASGRLSDYALVSNESTSISSQVLGIDLNAESDFQNRILFDSGSQIPPGKTDQIILGSGLAKSLGSQVGDRVSLIGQSLSGSIDSIEFEFVGSFKTGLSEADNTLAIVPLQALQNLKKVDSFDRIIVKLNEGYNLENAVNSIQKSLALNFNDDVRAGQTLQAKSWLEIEGVFYNQVKEFYKIQNIIVESLLVSIVLFSLFGTIGLSIYERIREISTMQALGDRKFKIFLELVLESTILAVIGILLAIPVSSFISILINNLGFEIVLPLSTVSRLVSIAPTTDDYFKSAMILVVTILVSVVWPAYKTLRVPIVDGLRN